MRLLPWCVGLGIAAACQPAESPTGDESAGATGGSTAATGGSAMAGVGGSVAASGGTGGTTAGTGTGGSTGGMTAGGSGGTPPATGGVAGVGTGGTAGGGAPPLGGTGGVTAGAGGSDAGSSGAGGTAGTSDAGTGNTAGTGNVAGTGGMPPALGCTGSELLCEDFEDTAEGMVPAGAPWQPLDMSCMYQTSSFTMGVTGALFHAGTKSLKVTNKHFAQCRLSGSFQAVDEFWVRAYSYWETGLDITNRETLDIDLTPGFRTADDPAVRFGYRSKAPCEQYAGPQITIIGLAGGEATGCSSREMPKGEWFCFEAHVQQSSNLVVSTYLNGETLMYQSTGKPATATIQTETAIAQKVDHIRLGIFSTGEAQGSIYLDDVAVSTTRLGCGS